MLDLWQAVRQIAFLAASATWPDPPSAVVLTGGAAVSEDDEENFLTDGGPNGQGGPFAIVHYKLAAADDEHQELDVSRVFAITVVARGKGDRHGSTPIVGGARAVVQGSGKSEGRGVTEIVGQLRQTFDYLVDSIHGLKGGTSSIGSVQRIDGALVASQSLEIVVQNSPSARYYHTPFRFALTGAAGSITMNWANGPARFDSVGLVARYASGSTPPATPASGLPVPGFPATGFPTTFTFTSGAGTWSVALFNSFDEVNSPPATPGRWSASSILSSGTITV